MKLYLDVCCLNRPFDDQTQDRIRLESEAVLLILQHIEVGEWQWIGSGVMSIEIERTPDPERRLRVSVLMEYVHHAVSIEEPEIERGRELEELGFDGFDALHLACAESGNADVFLTTDDKLLRRATKFSHQLHVQVYNPLDWLEEVMEE